MANPYYIPSGPSIGERVAQPLTELMRIRQAGQLGEEHNRLMGEDLALRTQALEQGKLTLAETQRANRVKEPLSRQNFGPEEKKLFMETIKQIDPEGAFKFLDKATEAMVKNPKADKGYLFGHLLTNWDTFYNPQAVRSVNEILANPEVDPATKDYYKEILKALQSPNSAKVLDKLMPNVAQEYQAVQQGKQSENTPDKIQLVNDFIQRFGRNPTEQEVSQLYGMARPQQPQPPQYHPPITTSQGILGWNPAKQAYEPMINQATNQPYLPPVADTGLTGGKEAIKQQVDEIVKERKDVIGAVTSLDNIKQAKGLLNSGIITGTGAQWLTNMGSFLSSRLGFTALEDPVMNTQAFAATMGNQVGQIIKQFGSGTGLSDADREYAEKIVGGRITLNEGAIRKLIDINEKAFTNVIRRYNEKAEQAVNKLGKDAFLYDPRVNYDFGDKGKLPDGLSEEDLQYNMSKYGKSRQEVIDQFNKVRGAK